MLHNRLSGIVWYDEVKDYDFDNDEYSPATRHFTQLIWKATESLGVGQATRL